MIILRLIVNAKPPYSKKFVVILNLSWKYSRERILLFSFRTSPMILTPFFNYSGFNGIPYMLLNHSVVHICIELFLKSIMRLSNTLFQKGICIISDIRSIKSRP